MQIKKIKLNKFATLTCYLQESAGLIESSDKRRAVLIIPGGSYQYCSLREGEPVALAYLGEGFSAFVLEYSVGENAAWPAPLNDALCAYNTIVDNSAEWNIDAEKIAAVGFSAGGHLAASLCLAEAPHPAAMVLAYACLNNPQCGMSCAKAPAVVGAATKNTPPCFAFATFEDPLVPALHTIDFVRELTALDVPVECHIFQHGPHGTSLGKSFCANGKAYNVNPNVAEWFELSVRWLNDLFGEYVLSSAPEYSFPSEDAAGCGVDIVCGEMLKKTEYLDVIKKFYPFFDKPEYSWGARTVSLRLYNSAMPAGIKLADEQIQELDILLKNVKG